MGKVSSALVKSTTLKTIYEKRTQMHRTEQEINKGKINEKLKSEHERRNRVEES